MAGFRHIVWTAQGTTPGGDRGGAARAARSRGRRENAGYAPARALNMVCVVDRQWSGEIANRLRGVGRYLASRTIVCAVEPRRDAHRRDREISSDGEPEPGELALLRETVDRRARRAAPGAPGDDRRPARRDRPADGACGRRTATTRRSTRCCRWRRSCCSTRSRSPTSREALDGACELLERAPTSSTSPGCARRPGASASPRPSIRRTCAPSCARSAR